MNLVVAISLLGAAIAGGDGAGEDTPYPTPDSAAVRLQPVTVAVSLKHGGDYDRQPVMATSLDIKGTGNEEITESKALSATVPNMLHADYGARMTSSIYVRGLGSRMDNPAVGLYVDGVPVMNKNNYDFDYFDLSRIDVLRGPQGTLYGRNTIGGVIDIQTISPLDYQGVRLGLGFGNAGTLSARAAIYRRPRERFGWSLVVAGNRTDGYFHNKFDGSMADSGRSRMARVKLQWRLNDRWSVDNSLSVNTVSQRGFAYAQIESREINHNDPCSYGRFGVINGLTFRYIAPNWRLNSTTGYQFTDDDMILDNDFTAASMFTLRQSQIEHAVTQEVTARSTTSRRWQWIGGFFGFHRALSIDAPVAFGPDGIRDLIEANSGMEVREEELPIESRFDLPSTGGALYHQSSWELGLWSITAGIRADVERTAIDYKNQLSMHLRPAGTETWYAREVEVDGGMTRWFVEVMPRAAVMRRIAGGSVYASVTRGYKAGGYNTQIFSDIIQAKITSPSSPVSGIDYAPERSWNYEVGAHLKWLDGRLHIDAALFWIDCRNQQLTVFPAGMGTGRMMSNAGRTRSLGVEISGSYVVDNLRFTASYGHTNARFVRYDDGRNDYAGKRVPYAPTNTLAANAEWRIGNRRIGEFTLGVGTQAIGRIEWNETNSMSQPFYALLNASIGWQRGKFGATIWGRNILDTQYDTFYFRSVNRSFVQRGKPMQCGLTLFLTI